MAEGRLFGNGASFSFNDLRHVAFTASGTFTVPAGVTEIDIFLVGGGGGCSNSTSGAGGGGGYTKTVKNIAVTPGQQFAVTIGAGGGTNADGGTTSFGSQSAAGGKQPGRLSSPSNINQEKGGDGGSGGGGGGYRSDGSYFSAPNVTGGQDGADGMAVGTYMGAAGKGQGSTTRPFGADGGWPPIVYPIGNGGAGMATAYVNGYYQKQGCPGGVGCPHTLLVETTGYERAGYGCGGGGGYPSKGTAGLVMVRYKA